ncbi:hypothetical protein ACT2CV_03790 [Pasteurellaceae bacterium 22721_9_1]
MKQIKRAMPIVVFLLPTMALANDTVVDQQHAKVKETLHSWSNTIDDWVGTPDPNKPASANLRLMLDSAWNHYDGYSIKPRVRAKIRLPALKKHISVVMGDEDLDNQSRDGNQTAPNYRTPLEKDKHYDKKQARHDNNSFAIRWSDGIKQWGIDTDVDLGIRSGADVFLRFKASKTWQHDDQFSTRLEQIYRYGIKSKHYLRTNLENKFEDSDSTFFNNHTYLEYTHDEDENTTWGNSLYRQHNFAGYKRLNYGLSIGGDIGRKKFDVNHYGPFVNWRQPILREWVFIQPELTFYNDRKHDRKHHLGAFLRLEVIF